MLSHSTTLNLKLRKFFGKTKMAFVGIGPQHYRFWLSVEFYVFVQKTLEATLLFEDFSKAFDSILRGKMEQILLAYGLLRETIADIMILYKNMKVCSLDGDTDFFDIVTGVLQGDTLALYLFIICLGYILWTLIDIMKENGFTLEKARRRQYPTQTITDAGYTDDRALQTNTPTQAKSMLHRRKWGA